MFCASHHQPDQRINLSWTSAVLISMFSSVGVDSLYERHLNQLAAMDSQWLPACCCKVLPTGNLLTEQHALQVITSISAQDFLPFLLEFEIDVVAVCPGMSNWSQTLQIWCFCCWLNRMTDFRPILLIWPVKYLTCRCDSARVVFLISRFWPMTFKLTSLLFKYSAAWARNASLRWTFLFGKAAFVFVFFSLAILKPLSNLSTCFDQTVREFSVFHFQTHQLYRFPVIECDE